MEVEHEVLSIYVVKRPGISEFLKKMSEIYEIVIYTASLALYADPLLDKIDSNHYGSYRLFREHCTFYNQVFVKDLSKLGRNLKDVIIVDNSPTSYLFQPENAIPIITWIDDMQDTKLFELGILLELMNYSNDVRKDIQRIVKSDSINYMEAISTLRNIWKLPLNSKIKLKNPPKKKMKLVDTGRNTCGAYSSVVLLNSKVKKEFENGYLKKNENVINKKNLSSKKQSTKNIRTRKATPEPIGVHFCLQKNHNAKKNVKDRLKAGTPCLKSGKISSNGKYEVNGNTKEVLGLNSPNQYLTTRKNNLRPSTVQGIVKSTAMLQNKPINLTKSKIKKYKESKLSSKENYEINNILSEDTAIQKAYKFRTSKLNRHSNSMGNIECINEKVKVYNGNPVTTSKNITTAHIDLGMSKSKKNVKTIKGKLMLFGVNKKQNMMVQPEGKRNTKSSCSQRPIVISHNIK